jgi:3-hydroxyisobutyrate dehydrogenase-like beta-hydroxyacid dehydrogenase
MNAPPIGLIGIGLLGAALAERMLAAGRQVVGYDLSTARRDHLRTLGGQPQDAPNPVATACQELVLCLPDSRVVGEVVAEIKSHLREGTLIVDATTGDPAETAALAGELARRGVRYIDATIAGSSEQVRRGEAVVIVGGEPADVARGEPILAAWSRQRFHAGPAGSGAQLKLIVNLVLGLHRAVLAEGLSLAEACGLDLAATLAVLKATPAYSRMMDTKGDKMIRRDYAPQARLAQHRKDVGLIRDLARRAGAPAPLTAVHEDLLIRAIELGLGDADNSAIMEVYRIART